MLSYLLHHYRNWYFTSYCESRHLYIFWLSIAVHNAVFTKTHLKTYQLWHASKLVYFVHDSYAFEQELLINYLIIPYIFFMDANIYMHLWFQNENLLYRWFLLNYHPTEKFQLNSFIIKIYKINVCYLTVKFYNTEPKYKWQSLELL